MDYLKDVLRLAGADENIVMDEESTAFFMMWYWFDFREENGIRGFRKTNYKKSRSKIKNLKKVRRP